MNEICSDSLHCFRFRILGLLAENLGSLPTSFSLWKVYGCLLEINCIPFGQSHYVSCAGRHYVSCVWTPPFVCLSCACTAHSETSFLFLLLRPRAWHTMVLSALKRVDLKPSVYAVSRDLWKLSGLWESWFCLVPHPMAPLLILFGEPEPDAQRLTDSPSPWEATWLGRCCSLSHPSLSCT